jgi:hypothetical protein
MKIPPSSRLVSGPAPAIRASAAGPGASPPSWEIPPSSHKVMLLTATL